MSVVPIEQIAALQCRPNRIRNICILAHVDHGKTTLSDYLVSSNGIISPKLAGRIRYLDSREDEQERQITMKSSCISLLYNHRLGSGTSASAAANSTLTMEGPYLINLIDSPGHVDFSSEVSNAVRTSDGALLLVDVLEGVCVQTQAVLQQAWREGVRPCVVLNKMDRLISELKMTPMEAYQHLNHILETLNAYAATLLTGEAMAKAQGAKAAEAKASTEQVEEEFDGSVPHTYEVDINDADQLSFSPSQGNVIFASAIDCWAFTIPQFAEFYAAKLGMRKPALERSLWGNYYYNPKTKMVTTKAPKTATGAAKPMFVQMILDNIWQVYTEVLENQNAAALQKIIKSLDLKIPQRDLASTDWRLKMQAVFSKWLPISNAILGAVVEHLPSPVACQGLRVPRFWPGVNATTTVEAKTLVAAVNECDPKSSHVLVFVAKMVDVGGANQSNSSATGPPKIVRQTYVRGKFTGGTASNGTATAGMDSKQVPSSAADDKSSVKDSLDLGSDEHHKRKGKSRGKYRDDFEDDSEKIKAVNADAANMAEEHSKAVETPVTISNDGVNSAAPSSSDPAANSAISVSKPTISDEERFIGFARIFCGTLDCSPSSTQVVHIFAPKYDPHDPATYSYRATVPATALRLFLLMGREIERVDKMPAGNIFGIGGLGRYLLNWGTVSTVIDVVPFAPMSFQSAPIVRVAIEPNRAADMSGLTHGLKLLSQADPNVEVSVEESGELLIAASGELHLERCLRDLKDRFAVGIPITVSAPLVDFRETVVSLPGDEQRAREQLEEKQRKAAKKRQEAARMDKKKLAAAEEDERASDPVRRAGSISEDDETAGNSAQVDKQDHKSDQDSKSDGEKNSEKHNDDRESDAEDDRKSRGVYSEDTSSVAGTSLSGFSSLAMPFGFGGPQTAGAPAFSVFAQVGHTANRCGWFRIRAVPLPQDVARVLYGAHALLRRIHTHNTHMAQLHRPAASPVPFSAVGADSTSPNVNKSTETALHVSQFSNAEQSSATAGTVDTLAKDLQTFIANLREAFQSAGSPWTAEDVDRIIAIGPRRGGTNLLINKVPALHFRSVHPLSISSAPETSQLRPGMHDIDRDTTTSLDKMETASFAADEINFGPPSVAGPIPDVTDEPESHLTRTLENSIVNGFQLATAAGPLCAEPLMGVGFLLEDMKLIPWDQSKGPDPFGPMSGQVIAAVSSLCRKAFSARSMRLMEAIYSVDLQCTAEVLGKLYAVLAKRRGQIVSEEMKEGTPYFLVKAVLPVAESFGFAQDVRKKTSGIANPQLVFSHWALIAQDPFWEPTTEEEKEEFGDTVDKSQMPNLARDIIHSVRRRKGLKVEEKTVKHATKQRTMARKK